MRSNYRTRSTLLLDQSNHGRRKNEELGWTLMNKDELVNPSTDLKMRERENLPVQIYCGGMPWNSGSIQGDAAAGDEDDGALCGGGRARAVGVRGRKKKRQGERMERPVGFIYKEKGISGRRKNWGAWSGKEGAPVALIFGIPLMKGIFLIFLYRDDVMMVRCCIQRMTSRRFNKVYRRRH